MSVPAEAARQGETTREPTFLRPEQTRVDEVLAGVVTECVPRLATPLRGPVEYGLLAPGKRIRPILCITAYRAAAGEPSVPEAAYRLACAPEIVHTYSLIHDDLPCMDDDDLRRGRATVHRVYGNVHAVLAGAVLLPLAIEVLVSAARSLGLPPERITAMVTELTVAIGAEGMVGGQHLDLQAEGRPIAAVELERIHRLKTGSLLTASLRVGAIAGGAGERLLQALTRYGESLGLAFQIADDLLDVEGSATDLGKISGRDQALSKASYPALFGVETAREMAREKVAQARLAVEGEGLTDLADLAEYVLERRR